MAARLSRYSELLASGWSRGLVRGQVTQGSLLRLTRGVYGPPAANTDDRLAAIFERLPDGAVAGFHTGAMLHGFGDARSTRCHVIVPAGSVVPQIRGVVAHESVVPVRDPVRIRGLPCAPIARCAVDLARSLRRTEAIAVLDLCLRVTDCHQDVLRDELGRHRGLRGVRQARELIGLADPRAECRQESQLRLLLVDAGLPAPEPQLWVDDGYGIPLYRIDLAYRKRRIGIEYDGQSHLDPQVFHYDRARSNWLAGQGWRMRHFTADDLYRRPTHIITTIHSLLAH
ncbi:endonuclease domain-containing protein [Verrucosispora sp. TAA-831]|uniref:endonuclease domain-containing protein n=1 Tax=Verrucosispora sp. TAA-831 TaxID=3422227 RepID=UPI003D6FB86B